MRIRWLRVAPRNLDDEAAFIALDNEAGVQMVVQPVLEAAAQLSEQAGLGRPGRVPDTRHWVALKTRHVVPYRVRRDLVTILRVFHTSRQLPKRG